MGVEDLIAKDASNKRDTEWCQHAQLIEKIPHFDQDITRFRQRMNAALRVLVEYPTRIPYPEFKKLPRNERAMGTAIFTILNVNRASTLAILILDKIPYYVQKVLGKIQPTFDDLLAMPKPQPDQTECWLVYFDGTVRWEISEHPESCRKTDRIIRRGKYVGSSVDYRGGGVRLDRHTQAAMSKRSSEIKQRHHEELCKEGTEANLRILACFECDPQIKSYVPIVETIFMTLIGTFVGRERAGEHNPQACYNLYDRVRSRARMPDIAGDGLNGALSIHQGVIGVSSGRQTYYCIICKRELRPNTSHRDHSRLVEQGNPLGPRRCQTCDRVFKDHGEERILSANGSCYSRIEPREQHKLWVAAGHPDVCGNPVCATARVSGASFSGWMEKSRCQNCASFLNYQKKKNPPQAKIKERQPQERELVARRHVWIQNEDEVLKATSKAGMKFMEIVVEYFPQMTAQILRERIALLKINERKARRQDLKIGKGTSKAPDWTDDEIQVLKNGIAGRKTAKTLLPLVPQRTITSIRTKISCLKKVSAIQVHSTCE